MSVNRDTIPLIQSKGNLMCAVCHANENGITFYSVRPTELCDTHFFEWQEEKMIWELDRSTEGMYV